MAEIPPTRYDPAGPTPLSRLDRVDRACDRFEDAWAAGGDRPSIEAGLAQAPAADRPALFPRLLALELDLRRAADDAPVAAPYLARFPGQAEVIAAAFAEPPSAEAEAGACTGFDFRLAGPPTFPGSSGLGDLSASPPPTLGPRAEGPEAPGEPLPVGTILGEYELLEPIGQGGMGIVYRAWQRGAERVVALKLIQPRWLARLPADQAADAVEMFLAEARTAAGLAHENVVAVHDVGRVDGQPYYSMRCVDGRSLAQALRAGPLADARAVALLEPVARAVQHAHERGVLHRDLKPANILVDDHGTPYVADFGLAKLLAAPAAPGWGGGPDRVGTPSYMSPEQARGLPTVGRASDVYGLGATLYEALTGRPPFRAAGYRETLRQVIRDEVPPPRRLNPAIARDLEAICLKCLEKEPHRRYASAERLADDLRRWQRGAPTEARPVSRPARAARWVGRRPLPAAAAAALVASLIGLSAQVRRYSDADRHAGVLAQGPPDGATEPQRTAVAGRRAEAAIALARSGRAPLARALLKAAADRRIVQLIEGKLSREPPEIQVGVQEDLGLVSGLGSNNSTRPDGVDGSVRRP